KEVEQQLPICSDNLQAVLNGTCNHSNLHQCLFPTFREKCRRNCGYCPEQSRIDCGFATAVNPEYLHDHPNYNYRCQYIRAISNRKCDADEKVAINPITDCMLSCGRYACSKNDIEEDRGYNQIPVMELYVPQKNWQFAKFGSKSSVSKRSQTDESLPSSKSEALKSSSQSIGPLEKEKSVNASTEIPGKSITMIPKVTTRTSKDMQVAKLTDEKSKSNEEVKGTMIKEQKQNIQENNGLTDEKEELSIEPKNLRWTGDGGYQTVQLRNITTDRLAVKAKCSDNELYRVNPVFGFIDPGKELKVDIIRRKAIPKVDKMIFVSVRANKEDVFPKPLFKRSKDSQKMAMLPLLVARVI
ncbi:unnamed protein product, partial [Onchocerca ochengi]|uniref:Major sperm protein n=1 Tax=Onchocerca ochengi TaxID=42157 RepID=A0A182E0K8_ONCOC